MTWPFFSTLTFGLGLLAVTILFTAISSSPTNEELTVYTTVHENLVKLFAAPAVNVPENTTDKQASAEDRHRTVFPSNNYVYYVLPCAVLGLSLWYLYGLLFTPLSYVRKLEDIGYYVEGSKYSKRELANLLQKKKKIAQNELPPVYPNGWFRVLRSLELAPGQAKTVHVLGEHLAVFRSEDGQDVYALDAYCPHLGADIGLGGRVQGNCLECPFHGWTFRGEDGKCTKIGYSEKVPEMAKTRSWNVLEKAGLIFVWYHAEGAEPQWTPPYLEGVDDGEWIYRGYSDHTIATHVEDFSENAGDFVHFNFLHKESTLSGSDIRTMYNWLWDWMKHTWESDWCVKPDEPHISILNIRHQMNIMGRNLGIADVSAEAKQVGPGLVYLTLDLPLFGKMVLVSTVTPEEPLKQRVILTAYSNKCLPAFLVKIGFMAELIQMERDIAIWNSKTYVSKPWLLKEDTVLAKHRRWYSQFFSENSPRLHFQKINNNTLDW